MAAYFFDSSALVKRYVSEIGTMWVVGVTDLAAGNRIYIARITGVEVIAAITKRARAGSISATNATAAMTLYRHDFLNNFTVVDITVDLISEAMRLAEKYALRGYDAVQLAAALDVQSRWLILFTSITSKTFGVTLVSADTDLNTAAMAEGLPVDDPNAHP